MISSLFKINLTYKLFANIYMNIYNLALNNPQGLLSHKTQPTEKNENILQEQILISANIKK